MPVLLEKAMARLSRERRARIDARVAELVAEQMTLRDLRKAHELTQAKIAKLLGVNQVSVSNIEKRSDLLLSTLRSYVGAMGGDLTLLVSFKGRAPVALKSLGDALGERSRRSKHAPTKRKVHLP